MCPSLPPVQQALDSLTKHKVPFTLYDKVTILINVLLTTHSKVRVEPTDVSFREASDFAKAHSIDAFLAVGGGSVIDTAKAANLYSSDPGADLLDYVNAPIGETLTQPF